jgi:hypothetical protein
MADFLHNADLKKFKNLPKSVRSAVQKKSDINHYLKANITQPLGNSLKRIEAVIACIDEITKATFDIPKTSMDYVNGQLEILAQTLQALQAAYNILFDIEGLDKTLLLTFKKGIEELEDDWSFLDFAVDRLEKSSRVRPG